jgi:hypothetical protein
MNFQLKNFSGGNFDLTLLSIPSSNDFKFSELPPINKEHKERVESTTTPFSGKPDDILYEVPQGTLLFCTCLLYRNP